MTEPTHNDERAALPKGAAPNYPLTPCGVCDRGMFILRGRHGEPDKPMPCPYCDGKGWPEGADQRWRAMEHASGVLITGFPNVRGVRTMALRDEDERVEIEHDGVYVGTIVYVRRRHRAGGSTYGWRPERSHANSRLLTKREAAEQVLISAAVRVGPTSAASAAPLAAAGHRRSRCPDECGAPVPIPPTPTGRPCAFGDPTCPCQDGDPCHYIVIPGTPAMTPPTGRSEP